MCGYIACCRTLRVSRFQQPSTARVNVSTQPHRSTPLALKPLNTAARISVDSLGADGVAFMLDAAMHESLAVGIKKKHIAATFICIFETSSAHRAQHL